MSRESETDLLDAAEEQRLSELLRCAFAPSELDPRRHERLLQAALEDPFAPPSAEEIVESERLRRALDGDGDSVEAALARALSAAHAPSPLTAPLELPKPAPRRTAKLIYVAFGGLAATLSAAAALLLFVSTSAPRHEHVPELSTIALAQSRSTAALFQADSAGAPSSRIDRIASARSRDLRDNRYALWGVR